MTGRRQKHPDSLVFKRAGRYRPLRTVVPKAEPMELACPEGLHPKAQKAWALLSESDLGRAFKATDVFGLKRWIWYCSEWHRAIELQGDRRYVFRIERAIRELEKAYGLDPLSRLRLGLTLVDEARAVHSLKARVLPEEFRG
jgi:hypothetical protein